MRARRTIVALPRARPSPAGRSAPTPRSSRRPRPHDLGPSPRSPSCRFPSPTHRGGTEPHRRIWGFDRPDPGNTRAEVSGGSETMIRRILSVVAIVLGVLVIFTSHAFGISGLHLLAIGVVVLGVALLLAV